MINLTNQEVLETIKSAVVTVPGVKSFSNFKLEKDQKNTNEISEALEIYEATDVTKFKIHIILIYGVDIRDVVNEVQIRVKYELEKLSKFTEHFIVDVAVDDLVNV